MKAAERKNFPLGFVALAAVVLAAAVLVKLAPQRPARNGFPIYGRVPDFVLSDTAGKPYGSAELKGHVWIADFMFTHCAGVCPLMSGRMKALQQKIAGPEPRFVSVSVDPERDTPAVLSAYAKRYDADPARWVFLTGDKAQIHRLSEQHFLLAAGDIPEAEREELDQSVRHSSKFVLVDAHGDIRGYYESEQESALGALARDAAALAAEAKG